MSGQWEGKVIQPLWETASLLQLNMWVLGTQDLTARCENGKCIPVVMGMVVLFS